MPKNPFSHYYNTQYFKGASTVTTTTGKTSYGPQSFYGGRLLGYGALSSPPRVRPFERGYDLSALRYYQYGAQQVYKQQYYDEQKYEKQAVEAAHYTKYLARLMLQLRKQRGLSPMQMYNMYNDALQTVKSTFGYNATLRLMRMGFYDRLRPKTGELVYNPFSNLTGQYGERRAWIWNYRHYQNYDPQWDKSAIFRDFREARARRDFYIKQIDRLIKTIPLLLQPEPPKTSIDRPFIYKGDALQISTQRRKKKKGRFSQKGTFRYGYYSRKANASTGAYYSRRYY